MNDTLLANSGKRWPTHTPSTCKPTKADSIN